MSLTNMRYSYIICGGNKGLSFSKIVFRNSYVFMQFIQTRDSWVIELRPTLNTA